MIPLTFPMLGSGSDAVSKDPVEVSLSSACPTCLTVWAPNAEGCATGRPSHSQGIAIGCEDGTVYILQTIPLSKRRFSESSPTFPLEVTSPSRGTSPLRYPGLGGSTSRSASPSSNKSNSSPFHVSRSRIVSSVSTEQVEAPKNYVDFDEEPDKLKGMLMGRGVKEKSHGDSLSPNVDRSNVSEKCSRSPSKHRPRALSPASSVKSSLSPPSPLSQSFLPVTVSQDMNEVAPVSLKYHFFPSRFGYLHPIIAMQPYDADHIVCLQQTGCITILTTVDGTCAASTSVDQNGVLTSHSDSLSKAPATWIWKSLSVFRSEKTNIIFACASRNVVHASGYSSDPSEDASEDQSRISMFEIRVGWGDDLAELSIQKIEDWCVDGRVDSVGFLQEVYDSFTLFHVSSLRRLTLQTLSFVNTPSPAESPIPDQGSNTTLPLPNPFKALQALSRERVSETEGCTQTPGRVLFGEELDIGEIAVDGPILGVRTVSLGTVARAVFWSGSEFSASFSSCPYFL
ncbi:hypothetical protein AcV7_005042 [Taiwanofungus camphoratus]|nr:hypothetical protein AcV7_005042 [Antrodia cinnamomea]